MLTIIWAFGAMVVLIGIISFLPIGITLKGKMFIVLAGFVIALGGLAANSTFPLWTTYLLLFVLTFLAAYIMQSRMIKVLFTVELPMEDEFIEDPAKSFSNKPKEITDEVDLLDLSEIPQITPSSLTKLDSNTKEDESLSLLKPSLTLQKEKNSEIMIDGITLLDEAASDIEVFDKNKDSELEDGYLSDIESILIEGPGDEDGLNELVYSEEVNILVENVNEEYNSDEAELKFLYTAKEDTRTEQSDSKESLTSNYLSEIESMLLEESKGAELVEEDLLDVLEDFEPIKTETEEDKKSIHKDQIEESELELLFAFKEVALGQEERPKETSLKKKVELDK